MGASNNKILTESNKRELAQSPPKKRSGRNMRVRLNRRAKWRNKREGEKAVSAYGKRFPNTKKVDRRSNLYENLKLTIQMKQVRSRVKLVKHRIKKDTEVNATMIPTKLGKHKYIGNGRYLKKRNNKRQSSPKMYLHKNKKHPSVKVS